MDLHAGHGRPVPRHRSTVVATVAALAALAVLAAACTSGSSGSSGDAQQLMSQTAASGSWTRTGDTHTLILNDVSPSTVVFTERPERSAESIPTASLVSSWGDAFGDDPPNAAVVLSDADESADTIVATLHHPRYDPSARTLTYSADLVPAGTDTGGLDGVASGTDESIPSEFGAVAVFIDGTDAPLDAASTTTTTTAPTQCSTAGSPTTPVTMSIVNASGYPDDQVYVALTGVQLGGSLPNGDPMPTWDASPRDLIDTSVPLSCLTPDPSVPGGHAYTFQLGQGIGSGLLWVSLGSPVTTDLPGTQPSFDTTDYRFANVEFAYPGQGDMTNVDQFSFPVDLATYASPTAAPTDPVLESSAYRADTCTIVDSLRTAVEAAPGGRWEQVVVEDAKGDFVRVLSPKQRAQQLDRSGTAPHTTPNPFAQGWPSLDDYMRSMVGKDLVVEGLFTPGASSADVADTGWYSYAARVTKDEVQLSGTIRSAIGKGPDPGRKIAGSGAVEGKPMTIALDGVDTVAGGTVTANNDLLTGLYDQSSRYSVDGVPRNGMHDGVVELAAPDDVYNSIYRDFVTAFTYGYWGGRYGDSNAGFWGSIAPPKAPEGGQPAFEQARTGKETFLPYNLYSKVMFEYSDNYNIPYGEDYGSGAPSRPSPLLDVPTGGTWRMTIQSDGTTESCPSSGFTPGSPPSTTTTTTPSGSTSTSSSTTTTASTSTTAPGSSSTTGPSTTTVPSDGSGGGDG